MSALIKFLLPYISSAPLFTTPALLLLSLSLSERSTTTLPDNSSIFFLALENVVALIFYTSGLITLFIFAFITWSFISGQNAPFTV